jgi:hypothetical protein
LRRLHHCGLQRNGDRLPAAVRGARHRALQRPCDSVPDALPAAMQLRSRVPDDRLSPRPAHLAASVPDMQRGKPLLSVSRDAEQGLAEHPGAATAIST